jgi:N-acetyl-1-D-myo-inositol-2-amino-2-deoxy-alpha-D-glucopyranoside deacetylase
MPEVLSLMCVHAHPDDESIGTGGTLAKYSAENVMTSLITCTRGEEGEIRDPRLVIPPYQSLGDVRTNELKLAMAVLKVNFVNFLGYRDSGMAGEPSNDHADCFWQCDFDEAVGRLVLNIRKLRPQVLVTYDANGGYGHPDHIMAHRVTQAAFDQAGDPDAYYDDGEQPWQPSKLYHLAFSMENYRRARQLMLDAGLEAPFGNRDPEKFGLPDEEITARIDVSKYVDIKRKALACHRSQVAGGFWLTVPDSIWAAAFGEECFVRVRSLVPAPDRETDLFAGLREQGLTAEDYSLRYAQPVGTHFVM